MTLPHFEPGTETAIKGGGTLHILDGFTAKVKRSEVTTRLGVVRETRKIVIAETGTHYGKTVIRVVTDYNDNFDKARKDFEKDRRRRLKS